jgi:hypothetical protein
MKRPYPQFLSAVIPVLCIILTFSCASTYKPVNLPSYAYDRSYLIKDSLQVSYQYNIQQLSGNRRYTRKEKKRNMNSVGVKITNVSSSPITLTRNSFQVYSKSGVKNIHSPLEYSKKVKQRVGMHLLHSLWGPWAMSWEEDGNGETDFNFIYIPVGAIVGIGNSVRARNANKENRKTQEQNEIWNKRIDAGQTLYGLIAISAPKQDTLGFSNNASAPYRLQAYRGGPYTPEKKPTSLSHDFYMIMKNGKSYTMRTRINITSSEHFIEANQEGLPKIIKPSDTRTLSRMTDDGRRQVLGIPADSCWLFKIIPGQISAYYFLAQEIKNESVTAIQKGDGPVVPFSPQVLMDMVGGDPELVKLINNQKFVQAIKGYNDKNK